MEDRRIIRNGIPMLDLGEGWLSVLAPATTANLGPGFDVMGAALMCIEDIDTKGNPTFLGDIVHIKKTESPIPLSIRGVYVNGIPDHTLTTDINKNVVGIAAEEVLRKTGYRGSLEIILEKMPFRGSGMGSSAASVVSSAYGSLLISGRDNKEDIADIVVGCEVGKHPDNVLPALFGGIVACFGKKGDYRRLQNYYDPEIITLQQASDILRRDDPDINYKEELEKASDIPVISEIIKKLETKISYVEKNVREGQKRQYYNLLLQSLEHKLELYKDSAIERALEITREGKDQELTSLIKNLRGLKIEKIESDLDRIRTYEKRRQKRIERDRNYTSPRMKKELRDSISVYLRKRLKGVSQSFDSSDQKQDYRRLTTPEEIYPNLYFVLIKPDISISTVEARKMIPSHPQLENVVGTMRGLAKLLVSHYERDLKGFGEAMCEDSIVEPARAPLIPGFYILKGKALEVGAYGLTISGSGPACIGETDDIEIARRYGRVGMGIFKKEGLNSTAHICKIDMQGARRV